MTLNSDVLAVLLGRDLTDKIIANAADLSQVRPELALVASTSKTGKALFQESVNKLNVKDFSVECNTAVEKLVPGHLKDEDIEAVKTELEALVKVQESSSILNVARTVALSFLGLPGNSATEGPRHEAKLRLKNRLKLYSVGYKNGLTALIHEKWLLADHSEDECEVFARGVWQNP